MRVKNYLPQTLLARSTLIILLPVLILQIVTVYIFFDRHWSKTVGRLSDAVAGEVAVITNVIDNNDDPERAITRVLNYTNTHLGLTIRLIPNEQNIQSLSFEPQRLYVPLLKRPALDRLHTSLTEQLNRPFIVFSDDNKKLYEILVQLKSGALSVMVPERRLYSSSSYVFLVWMIGISLTSTLVSMLFLRNQIRPIRKLAIAAERFGRGQDVDQFKPQGAREVRAAARAFIDMRDRIKRQVEQRTVMLAGVSHDMRTPLTRIKLALSLLPDNTDIRALKSDVVTMENMLNAYLDFVKGEGTERSETVNIVHLIDDIVTRFKTGRADIQFVIPTTIYLAVRPVALSRAVSNILSNACRYGTIVWVNVSSHPEAVVITIEDNGPGIPDNRYDDAFRPFVRLDSARHLDTLPQDPGIGDKGQHQGSVGLGLAIARDLIHAHGGEITLSRSVNLSGLLVTINLPK